MNNNTTLVNTASAIRSRLYNNYSAELARQIIISCIITGLFCIAYYLLPSRNKNEAEFFEQQLILSRMLLLALGLQLAVIVYACRKELPAFFKNFLSENGSAYTLAVFRIYLFKSVSDIYDMELHTNFYWATLPHEMRVSLPFMGWFIQNLPINPDLYHVICIAGIACSLLAAVGLFTRWVTLINIPLGIYILGVPLFYGKLFHIHVWVWFPAIMALSQCGNVLSADWLLNKYLFKRPEPEIWHPRYGIPLRMIWIHLGIIYFVAGFIKLKDSGLTWALGSNMINQMQVEWVQHYNNIPALRIDYYPTIAHVSGIAAILFELYYPFLVLCAAGRVIACFGGIAMHRLIGYFMYIDFGDLQRTYTSYINWHRIWLWVKKPGAISDMLKPARPSMPFTQLLADITFKRILIAGLIMYSINFSFGLFKIHSWPFSSYPTYSMLVPSTHTYVYFKPYTKNGEVLDIYKLGKQDNYRMEDFTPIEDRIWDNAQVADTATMQKNIRKLWSLWTAHVPELRNSDSVQVYLRLSPVAPEAADSLIENKLITTFKHKE